MNKSQFLRQATITALTASSLVLPGFASAADSSSPQLLLKAGVSTARFNTKAAPAVGGGHTYSAPKASKPASKPVATAHSPAKPVAVAHPAPARTIIAKPAAPSQQDIKSTIALLEKYRQIRLAPSYNGRSSNWQMQQAALSAQRAQQAPPPQKLALSASAAAARFVHITPLAGSISADAAAGKKLPRWGDKDCLCHQGLKLFQQHRYLEAAEYYRKAGDNMRKAWGHDTWDEANARRGQAACLLSAGQASASAALFAQAADMYITSGKGRPAPQLNDTLLDLSTALAAKGSNCRASALKQNAGRLLVLAASNPPAAVTQLNKLIQ